MRIHGQFLVCSNVEEATRSIIRSSSKRETVREELKRQTGSLVTENMAVHLIGAQSAPLTPIALISDSWPENVWRHMPSRTSQSCIPQEKGINLPSPSKSKCIRKRINYFVRLFTLAEASQAPETKVRISGDRDNDMTSPVCPVKDVVCWPVSMSHSALMIRTSGQKIYITDLQQDNNRLKSMPFDHKKRGSSGWWGFVQLLHTTSYLPN